LTIEGVLGKIKLGDLHPAKIMAVINLSQESFYKGSFTGSENVLKRAGALVEEGAEVLDLGAVSTAPGSPFISEKEERRRLLPALRALLDCLDVEVSVDTQRAKIADDALSLGASCVNDVSGLLDPQMAKVVADHDGSLILMASRKMPGDILSPEETIQVLGERLKAAADSGIAPEKITVDPGIGHWVPPKGPEHDLALLDEFDRLRMLNRPVMAAVSRKSFIGDKLNRPDPEDRLAGTLAATSIAVYKGAHLVRTHDVAATKDVIRMAEAIRGRPPLARRDKLEVEVIASAGHSADLCWAFDRINVSEGGFEPLRKKGAFRALSVRGVTSMEAMVIKQEMLARGGDTATPMGALRCDPGLMEIIIFGTVGQIQGLTKNLKMQPFNLPVVGATITEALDGIEDPKRYR